MFKTDESLLFYACKTKNTLIANVKMPATTQLALAE